MNAIYGEEILWRRYVYIYSYMLALTLLYTI